MNINRKIFAVLFLSLGSLAAAVPFFALPRIKMIFTESLQSLQGSAPAGQVLHSLDRELFHISLFIAFFAAALLVASIYYVVVLLKPLSNFIKQVNGLFPPGMRDGLEAVSSGINSLRNNARIADCVPIGIMVVDLDGIIRFFNREAGEITETDPSSVTGRPMLEFFPNNYYSYTMEVIRTGREYLGLRNIIKAGSFFRELLLSISPMYRDNSVSGAVAVFQDVTPQRKLIEVQAAYNLAKDLVTQKDLSSTVRVISKAAAEMVEIEYSAVFLADREGRLVIRSAFGIPAEEVDKYNASPHHLDSPEISDLYRNKVPLLHGDVRNRPGIKKLLFIPDIISFYSFPILHEGRLIGSLNLYSREKNCLSRDKIYLLQSLSGQVNTAITNFYELQKMRTQASVDGLTGLFNKKHFLESLNVQLAGAASGSPVSLSMIDIDHFKKINDTFGHQAGDQLLKDVAGVILQQVRESDFVCRYGGEEFCVIMPGTPKRSAMEVVNRIRSAAEGMVFYTPEKEAVRITVSGGVACFPEDASTAEDLILFSDTALYAAKRSGRNKVVAYTPDLKMNINYV